MFTKVIILAIFGFNAAALALPTDTSSSLTSVPQMAAEDCWRLPEHDRLERRECKEFNDNCRHHDEHDWRGPEICGGHYYKKRDTTTAAMTAEECWRLPERDRLERRECREYNEQCRHRDLPDFILPSICEGRSFLKREETVAAEDCWRLNEHDRHERSECKDFNDHCRHSDDPHWKLPESCGGHFYN